MRRLRQENPGVAKFGIALEWGSRGPEFESQHSDQDKRQLRKQLPFVFAFSIQMSTALRTGQAVLSLYIHFMTRVSKYWFLPTLLNSNSLSAWSKRVECSNLSIARREHRYRCSRLVRWDLSPSSISPLIILQLAVPPSSQPHRLHLPVTGPLRCASIRNTPKFHKYLQIMIPCPQLHPNQTLPQNL